MDKTMFILNKNKCPRLKKQRIIGLESSPIIFLAIPIPVFLVLLNSLDINVHRAAVGQIIDSS